MKIHIVAEGKLEIPVAKKLINFCGHSSGTEYSLRGAENVRRKAIKYASLASTNTAVLVLTDFMDSRCNCIIEALNIYLGSITENTTTNFILRFAVNELESWLLADHINFSRLIGVPKRNLPPEPDKIADPKKYIANLVYRLGMIRDKQDLITVRGRQGRLYIDIMTDFIENKWNISRAKERSPSLSRCLKRLCEL